MPEISASKYMTSAVHWHRPERVKACILCGESKPLSEFYAYAYTTNQGLRSTRYESRCKPCARARRIEHSVTFADREAATYRAWYDANREEQKRYRAERQKDPAHRANKAKAQRLRKARIRSGQGDDPEIRAIYDEAIRLEKIIVQCPVFDLPELGKKLHVDHRIPLARGGQHVAANLQILPAGINLRKGASCPR